MGHLLTDLGIKPDPTKTDAVRSMPTPADKHDVQRFLGMTNYLSKFIPGYSEKTAPLRQLLLQDVEWSWLEHHMAAFTRLKKNSSQVLLYSSTFMCTSQWCYLQMLLSTAWVLSVSRTTNRWRFPQEHSHRLSPAMLR